MSRIGKKPIPVAKGVILDIQNHIIKIKGPNGELEREIRPEVNVTVADSNVIVSGINNSRQTNAFCGLTRSLINNMVIGVTKGFTKKLTVEGVGYKVNSVGSVINLNVGYSNTVEFVLPAGVKVVVEKNDITLTCVDKELLGQTAANIRRIRVPEPYKGKGIRYIDEHIVRKIGKAAGKK